MRDFMHRCLSETIEFSDNEGNKTKVLATRSRTSEGFASICLDMGGKRVLELTNDLDDYEAAARAIAALLDKMADESCTLPATQPNT